MLRLVVGVRGDEADKVDLVDVDVKDEAVVGVVGEGSRGCGILSERGRRSWMLQQRMSETRGFSMKGTYKVH